MTSKIEGINAETVEDRCVRLMYKAALSDVRGNVGRITGSDMRDAFRALLASGEVVLRKELDSAHHLLNHIHREVASLEDFDAASLMEEIEQTLNGTKIFDDNKFLNEQLVILRADHEAEMQKVRESVAGLVFIVQQELSVINFSIEAAHFVESQQGFSEAQMRKHIANEQRAELLEYTLSHFTTNHATTGETE